MPAISIAKMRARHRPSSLRIANWPAAATAKLMRKLMAAASTGERFLTGS